MSAISSPTKSAGASERPADRVVIFGAIFSLGTVLLLHWLMFRPDGSPRVARAGTRPGGSGNLPLSSPRASG